MSTKKPLASLSLDLDDLWTYIKTHGDPGWESFPSYLHLVVPRVLDFLKRRELQITFFIVGQDAALAKNVPILRSIAEAGHEIGNHSFHHEPWLHLYTLPQIESELTNAENAIQEATGQKPVGFRGPGFSLSLSVLEVLQRLGYFYDASTLPAFTGPLARAYYFMSTKLSPEEKKARSMLYNNLEEGWRPLHPYRWQLDSAGNGPVEIPITTMPLLKVPFHVSYILYLYRFSAILARTYFRMAMVLCRLTRTSPSLLLHSLDFVGCDEIKELSFFPAMDVTAQKKIQCVSEILDIYLSYFRIVTVKDHARIAIQQTKLRKIRPKFRTTTQWTTLKHSF